MASKAKPGAGFHVPDPLEVEELEGAWPKINLARQAIEAASKQAACLQFEAWLKANPRLRAISMDVEHESNDEGGSYIYLMVSPEFEPEEGADPAANLYGEDDDEAREEVREIFDGHEEEVAQAFASGKSIAADKVAPAIGKALLGPGYKAWMARREAAAIERSVPEARRSAAAPRM